ncbi:hypothetical protein ACWC09_16305 [Streptomyces sp. NPDC001617]
MIRPAAVGTRPPLHSASLSARPTRAAKKAAVVPEAADGIAGIDARRTTMG